MSLILDALRKSEAERRRNETPDLLTAVSAAPSAPPRRRPALSPRMLAIAASAVLMVALGVWLDRRAREDVIPVNDGQHAGTITGSVDTPSVPLSPVDSGDVVETTRPSPEIAVAPTMTPPPPAPAPPSSAPPLPPTQSAAAAAIDPPATLPSPRMPTGAIPPPAPAAPVVPTPTPPAHVGVTADAGAPLAPSQLGADTRRQMPPLKMSMHLWNEAASQRFVVLDGQRLGEGDVVGDVVVERIDRDAVIVVWRGERVRLPVR